MFIVVEVATQSWLSNPDVLRTYNNSTMQVLAQCLKASEDVTELFFHTLSNEERDIVELFHWLLDKYMHIRTIEFVTGINAEMSDQPAQNTLSLRETIAASVRNGPTASSSSTTYKDNQCLDLHQGAQDQSEE